MSMEVGHFGQIMPHAQQHAALHQKRELERVRTHRLLEVVHLAREILRKVQPAP